MLKVLIASGGTGGHIYPAIAVARQLQDISKETKIDFVGRQGGIEAEIYRKEGFTAHFLELSPPTYRWHWDMLHSLWQLVKSFSSAWELIDALQPDIVIGFGSYISLPTCIVAMLKNKPVAICEQNTVPGMANRILGKMVDLVLLAYEDSRRHFKGAKVVGNPVRKNILGINRQQALEFFHLEPERYTILVFGGSQGAKKINETFISALSRLTNFQDLLQVILITGQHKCEHQIQVLTEHGFIMRPMRYLHDMGQAYAAADLCISRAGSTTIAELTAVGLPAILIPYPHATGNHQYHNAMTLAKAGAAEVIKDAELDNEILATKIEQILDNQSYREKMRIASLGLAQVRAGEYIATEILKLADKHRSKGQKR